MSFQVSAGKIGYTRYEFGQIFQIYSQNVYSGLFRDFSFTEARGQYFISFKTDAGQAPLITIEKRRLGPDRNLFIATTSGQKGPVEIARSEKIDAFVARLKNEIDALQDRVTGRKSLRVVS